MSNGNGNTFAGTFKALLASPVGGWALCVIVVAVMLWFSFKDRQAMYTDVLHLRAEAMPVIKDGTKVAHDNYELLREINHKTGIILDMLKDEKDEKDAARISHPNVAP